MGEADSPLTVVQRENRRLQEEIQRVMMHNTKLQRDLMSLNASREHMVAQAHERVAQLTEELKQVDSELNTVRGDCDRIIAVICEHKQSAIVRSLGDLTFDPEAPIEEEDIHSDHSTASTASSTSSFRSTRSASRGGKSKSDSSAGRPPLSSQKSIDIDDEQSPVFTKPTARKVSDAPIMSQRDTIMSRISRSVKKAQSMPSADMRPSVQHGLDSPINSPMLAYKANAVLRATQSHLNNFRRHSGPYRRNRDTVVL